MEELFKTLSRMSEHDPLLVVFMVIIMVGFMSLSLSPLLFSFFILRDFKQLGLGFIEKFDKLLEKVDNLGGKFEILSRHFVDHKDAVSNRVSYLEGSSHKYTPAEVKGNK